ncbi:hypothetical protein, partial [Paenibacillus qinlingensis]
CGTFSGIIGLGAAFLFSRLNLLKNLKFFSGLLLSEALFFVVLEHFLEKDKQKVQECDESGEAHCSNCS